jgi:ribosomal protein L7/L12
MRITWNRPMNNDPRTMRVTFANEGQTQYVEEDMTPEMIRHYAQDLKQVADAVEKRLMRKAQLLRIESLVKNNQRIDAIKELRSLTSLDLLDAKEIIEMMCAFNERSK